MFLSSGGCLTWLDKLLETTMKGLVDTLSQLRTTNIPNGDRRTGKRHHHPSVVTSPDETCLHHGESRPKPQSLLIEA